MPTSMLGAFFLLQVCLSFGAADGDETMDTIVRSCTEEPGAGRHSPTDGSDSENVVLLQMAGKYSDDFFHSRRRRRCPDDPTTTPSPPATLPPTPTPLNGASCADFPDCCVKCETCDFAVALFFENGDCVAPHSNAYSRCPLGDGTSCLGQDDDWTPQNKASVFTYMQTAQFVLSDDSAPYVSNIYVSDQRKDGTLVNCMAVYHKDEFYQGFNLGTGHFELKAQGLVPSAEPLQLTFVPFIREDLQCDQGVDSSQGGDIGGYDGYRALGVFLSLNYWNTPAGTNIPDGLPADTTTCYLTEGDKYGSCGIEQPQWIFEPSSGAGPASVRFIGPLYTLLTNGDTSPVYINLDESLVLDEYPLNSMYINFPVEVDSGCQSAVSSLNNGVAPGAGQCVVGPPQELTATTGRRIVVTGFGVISGLGVMKEFGLKDIDQPDCGTQGNPTCDISSGFMRWADYRLRSALLTLSSSYNEGDSPGPQAIDISGVTVALAPQRHAGAVQLNSAYIPSDGGLDTNNFPVKVYDFKMPGNWVDAADGPEVMGFNFNDKIGAPTDFSRRSSLQYMYLLVNDDSIKVSTPYVWISDTTVLQGNVGGVMNIGAYGKNRGIEGSEVISTYVHRITQNTHNNQASFDNLGGVIVTRTCPVKKLLENPGDSNALTCTVDGLFVAGMGFTESDGSGQGPNSVTRPFSIGLQNSLFCSGDGPASDGDLAASYTVGPLIFRHVAIYTDPTANSFIYDCWDSDCNYAITVVNQDWGQINFGDTSDLDSAPIVYKFGSKTDDQGNDLNGYYVCSSALPASGCYNVFGQGGSQDQPTAATLDFSPNFNHDDNQIIYPYS